MRYQDAFDAFDPGPRATRGSRAPWDSADYDDQFRAYPGEFPTQADPFPAINGGFYDELPADDAAQHGGGRHRTGGGQGRGGSRGLLAGGVTGFLAAGVALGVANLAAAFVRPQASPIIAVGGAFIDRTPPALKNFAVQKFGENDKNMLLLGMYVTVALIAIAIGMIAWRHISVGIAGIGLFGAFGAFVAYTRPEARATDVIPSVVGGIVGMAVIMAMTRLTARREPPFTPEREHQGWQQAEFRSGWAA